MSVLPAAAIPEGSIVEIHPAEPGAEYLRFQIASVENSTPRPGKITWYDHDGNKYVMGGRVRVTVVELP